MIKQVMVTQVDNGFILTSINGGIGQRVATDSYYLSKELETMFATKEIVDAGQDNKED